MADNVTALGNTGTGTDVFATDEIDSVHYPRNKSGWGIDGVYVDVSLTNPMPVQVASLPLPTGAATETTLASLNAKLLSSTSMPSSGAAGINVRPLGQDTWVCSFADVGASVLSPDFRAPDVGTGVTYNQATGSLNIVAGTTANAEFLTRSTMAWRGSMQMRYSLVASQRIANNNFALILADLIGENLSVTVNSTTSITVNLPGHTFTALNVGQFIFVGGISGVNGVPGRYAIASVVAGISVTFTVAGWPASGSGTVDLFGWNHVRHIYNGTTPTNVLADAQRRGWQSGDTTLTINSTASPGHIMQAHLAGREVYWSDTVRATSTTPNVTLRGSRLENLPDDNIDLYLFMWSYNGATAPASSTTWTVGFAAVERFAPTPVYIQGQEMQGAAAAAPVAIVGTPAVSISGTPAVTLTSTTVSSGTVSPLTVAGVSVEASSAKTASGNSASAITNASGNGAIFFINVSAVTGTTPTLAVRLQVQDPVSSTWVDVPGAVTASITGIGMTMLTVCPGIIEAANSRVNYPLPRTFRVAWAIGGTTPSFTFSVGAAYII